ncbi:MAG: type II secretion system minor pseudopilin GspJ [Gammaproteobacteria bacterium]|nr:type II secretion system minor pseudopilin GspJ [Gammaproteobacteria bacterium]MCZ6762875.1 type II secretion system minor pseudopilin GspJ [Gammaproteobacteria bacterium]TDJ10515.1 MAG: type II secretion system protein GspJ [Gammaproteobacteria bacterium]
MTSIAKTRMRGFTLIEILVALAIFSLMTVMLFGGFIAISNQVDWSRARAARLQQIQTAMLYLGRDFSQLQPRPVRSELGDFKEAALSADARNIYLATLTRGGWSNPAGIPRSTLQRVAYQLEDRQLVRLDWPVLDRLSGTEPRRTEILDDVDEVIIRFLDAQLEWHENWPPLGSDDAVAAWLRPLAVEISIALPDLGRITRLLEIRGG